MLNVWNGTAWKTVDMPLVWDGTAWKHRTPKYFDGLEWQNQTLLGMKNSVAITTAWDVAGRSTPPPPPVQTYVKTKTFAADWSATYRGDNSKRTDTSDLYQGYNNSYQGNMKSLIGFNVGAFPAGSTCISATLSLRANHWYNNGGGVAVIGTHNKTSEPGTYSGSGVDTNRLRYTWNAKTGQRTINLGTGIGNDFIDSDAEGIVIGPAPSTSNTYYGYFEGSGSYRPVLTIKYQYTA